jgi:hypothetical protein
MKEGLGSAGGATGAEDVSTKVFPEGRDWRERAGRKGMDYRYFA